MGAGAEESLATAVLTPFSKETLLKPACRAFTIRAMQDPQVTVSIATRVVDVPALHSEGSYGISFATATVDGNSMQLLVEKGIVNQILAVGVDKWVGEGLTWFMIGSSMAKGIGVYQKLVAGRVLGALENGNEIMVRTENPRMEYSLRRVLDNLIGKGVIQEYSLERTVLKGFFAREDALRIEAPEPSKSEKINAIYSRELDHERGDAFELKIALRPD